jgi:hypothetical protein
MKKHSKYITHLDFSDDDQGKYLKSNCGNYELIFWDTENGRFISKPNDNKDIRD